MDKAFGNASRKNDNDRISSSLEISKIKDHSNLSKLRESRVWRSLSSESLKNLENFKQSLSINKLNMGEVDKTNPEDILNSLTNR